MPRAKKPELEPDLLSFERPSGKGGPIYQAVNRTIRALAGADLLDLERHAATIAQARSLAGSIDRASGAAGTRQASGMQLAAMHERLDALVSKLTPEEEEQDAFAAFLADLQSTTTDGQHGDAPAPHSS